MFGSFGSDSFGVIVVVVIVSNGNSSVWFWRNGGCCSFFRIFRSDSFGVIVIVVIVSNSNSGVWFGGNGCSCVGSSWCWNMVFVFVIRCDGGSGRWVWDSCGNGVNVIVSVGCFWIGNYDCICGI